MLLLQLLGFLIICVLLIVKPTASALFLSEYGAVGLPYIFLATAVLAAVVSTAYSAALRHYSLLRVSLISLLACLAILVGCAAFMRLPPARPTVAAVLYLWTAIFGVMAASQFWMMSSFVFDVRQAKRLFGLIGAGAIAGGIAGGYITSVLAREIGARNLILLAGALLVPCLGLTYYIWKRYVADKRSAVTRSQAKDEGYEAPHRLILGSKHLLLLCVIVALSVTAAKLVDYQFSVLAAERYGDQDRLAAFFGFWYSTFNIAALIIQLVVTHRVVQGLGVSGALLFLPAGLGLGAIVMLLVPGLNAATLSRSVDGSLKQSLGRASVEMLFLPLDEATKKRVKTYIDVFIDSLAGGIGGIILIALTQFMGVSAPAISWFILLLVIGWMVSVVLIREEYIDAFRAQLSHLQPKQERNRLKSHHRKVMAGFLQVLEEGQMSTHEKQLLYVLERTDDLSSEEFRDPIRRLLTHPSANVRSRALRSLYLQPGSELIEEVTPLLHDEDRTVRSAALDYLFSRPRGPGTEGLTALLEDDDPDVAGPALVSLAAETASNEYYRKQWQVGRRLRRRIKQLPEHAIGLRNRWYLYLLMASGRSNTRTGRAFVQRSLLSYDDEVVRYAVLAAGESQHESLIASLLHLITVPGLRPLVTNALVQYDGGLLGVIPKLITSGELSVAEVRRLPSVLEKIDRQQTVEVLFSLTERHFPFDLPLRMEVLRALNTVRRDFPKRSMPNRLIYRRIVAEARTYEAQQQRLNVQRLLRRFANSEAEEVARDAYGQLLAQRMSGTFNRMFRLLGLRYPTADIIPVHLALNSDLSGTQISGIEFLDNLLELSLKRLIIPLLDRRQRQLGAQTGEYFAVDDNVEALRKQEFKSFRRLLRGRDQQLKVSALRLIGTLGEARYTSLLLHYATANDATPKVKATAQRSLDRLRSRQQPAAV